MKVVGQKSANNGPWDQMLFFKEIEKKTGIKLEINAIDQQAYKDKKNLLFASNDLPDVFMGGELTQTDEVTFGSQGLLVPLEGYFDAYAPNLKKILSKEIFICWKSI